jgi:hypothetical protein
LTDTEKIVARILRRRKERNLRIHMEMVGLDLEEQGDAEGDIRKNYRYR